MAFNFFQKFSQKKGLPRSPEKKADKSIYREKISEQKDIAEKEPKQKMMMKQRPHEKNIFASKYIVSPHISEKASRLQEFFNDKVGASYTLKVTKNATKQLVKKAVQDRYEVNIDSIRIINTPYKKIRRGKITGRKPGYKKAIVTLRPGSIIEQL